MRKNLKFFFVLVLIVGFFISCDDDEGLQLGKPEVPETILPREVESVYHGQMVRIIEQQDGMGVKNVTEAPMVNNVILSQGENASMLTLKFQNLRLVNSAIRNWEVPNIALMKDGKTTYLIAETQDLKLWDSEKIVKVYVAGTIVEDSLHITIDVKTPGYQGSYGENMNFKFDGKSGHTIGTEATISAFSVNKKELVNKISLNEEKKEIVILVNKHVADENLVFETEIEKSEGAYLLFGTSVFSGKLDFTKNNTVTVKVLSEDGELTNSYKIYCVKLMDLNFAFDTWNKNNFGYDEFPGWTSNNEDFAYLKTGSSPMYTGEYPVQKGSNSAVIKTVDAEGMINMETMMFTPHKKVMAGFFYLGGAFDVTKCMFSDKFAEVNQLGTLYKSQPKPLRFQGTYSYTTGTTVYDESAQEVRGVADECLLALYLYEVGTEDEMLNAVDIHTSTKVVAKAEVSSGTTDSKNFDVSVEFKEGHVYDSSKSYKIAVLLTSSKNGHIYQGAPGSVLTVESINVTTE